jgi:hypothetical protein
MTSTLLVYQIDRLVLPNEDWRKLPSIKPHTESYFLSESSYNEISVEEDSLLQWN